MKTRLHSSKGDNMPKDNKIIAMKKLASYIGFAKKSGKITVGCNLTVDGIRSGRKSPLVAVISSDAAVNTKSRIENCCKYYEVPLVKTDMTSDQLGDLVSSTASVSVVGITDYNLAGAILKYFN